VKEDESEAPEFLREFLARSFHQRYLKLTEAQRIEYLRHSDEASAILSEACQPPPCYGFEALDEQSKLCGSLVRRYQTCSSIFITVLIGAGVGYFFLPSGAWGLPPVATALYWVVCYFEWRLADWKRDEIHRNLFRLAVRLSRYVQGNQAFFWKYRDIERKRREPDRIDRNLDDWQQRKAQAEEESSSANLLWFKELEEIFLSNAQRGSDAG
jgi:hypothetical protein